MASNFKYNNLFNLYYTSENIPFTLKNRSIVFPEDANSPIYQIKYISIDTPWTVLSYNLYNTIDYWWVLCSLNKADVFYAKEGEEIRVINPKFIDEIVDDIKNRIET